MARCLQCPKTAMPGRPWCSMCLDAHFQVNRAMSKHADSESVHARLSRNVRILREHHGFSQSEMARAMGHRSGAASRAYTSAVEWERIHVSMNRLEELARLLGVAPAVLLAKDPLDPKF